MVFQSYTPSSPLNDFISHFTYYKNYTPDHRIDRFLPDGNVEIVIELTDEPKFIYDNNTLAEIQACREMWISGIRTRFITIPSGRDSEMFIINFKKGMAYPFLNMPLSEISDTVVHGNLILNRVFGELRERLLLAPSIYEKFALSETLLLNVFKPALVINPFIQFAVSRMLSQPEVCTIKQVADKTGYSSKHFIKIFKEKVGVAPKTYLRIIRFQKAIAEMESKQPLNWAGLAAETGYFDQAHFIDDFKSFSGFTPVEYMKRKNGVLNYVPVG